MLADTKEMELGDPEVLTGTSLERQNKNKSLKNQHLSIYGPPTLQKLFLLKYTVLCPIRKVSTDWNWSNLRCTPFFHEALGSVLYICCKHHTHRDTYLGPKKSYYSPQQFLLPSKFSLDAPEGIYSSRPLIMAEVLHCLYLHSQGTEQSCHLRYNGHVGQNLSFLWGSEGIKNIGQPQLVSKEQ